MAGRVQLDYFEMITDFTKRDYQLILQLPILIGIDDPDETQADVVTRHDKKAQAILAKRDRLQRVLVLLECSRICLFKRKASSFICIYCDQGYVDPAKLREHNIEHEDVKPVDIKKAIARIDKPELLKADITDVSCKLCNTSIDRLDDLVKHLFEKHNKKIDLNAEIGILPYKMNLDDYICAICGEKFTDYKTLNHHMNLHYPRFVCEQCGSGFVTAMRLKSHVVTHETGSFPCNACDKVFNSKDAMKGHFAYLHMKVKKHSCPQCHEKFSNYSQRLKHLSSVHGMDLDEYKCNFCTRVFNAKGPLRSHIRASHLKEKSHACDECDATFFSKSCLRKHVVKHSGEKKHQCCVCLKAFGRKSTLVQHMRIHLNDRRFVCNVCEASFVQKCSLKQHGRTHHPNNPNPADQYD